MSFSGSLLLNLSILVANWVSRYRFFRETRTTFVYLEYLVFWPPWQHYAICCFTSMICHTLGFLPFRNVLQSQRLLRWTDKHFREKEREGLQGEGGGRRRGRQDVDEIVLYMTYPFRCKKSWISPLKFKRILTSHSHFGISSSVLNKLWGLVGQGSGKCVWLDLKSVWIATKSKQMIWKDVQYD